MLELSLVLNTFYRIMDILAHFPTNKLAIAYSFNYVNSVFTNSMATFMTTFWFMTTFNGYFLVN